MTVRPTFTPGDKVWFGDQLWPTIRLLGRDREFNQETIYTIKRVMDVDSDSIKAVGHHQLVDLVEDQNPSSFGAAWSGAFFELVVVQ